MKLSVLFEMHTYFYFHTPSLSLQYTSCPLVLVLYFGYEELIRMHSCFSDNLCVVVRSLLLLCMISLTRQLRMNLSCGRTKPESKKLFLVSLMRWGASAKTWTCLSQAAGFVNDVLSTLIFRFFHNL